MERPTNYGNHYSPPADFARSDWLNIGRKCYWMTLSAKRIRRTTGTPSLVVGLINPGHAEIRSHFCSATIKDYPLYRRNWSNNGSGASISW
jgi:hypothetical protein